jgi:Protein of unknown function (DUF1566)
MKHKLIFTLGLIVLGWAVLAAGPADAVTAAGPYYATPSWDQKLQCDTASTCPRFIVLSNWSSLAVLDRETGLVWEQSPSTGTLNWGSAQLHCNELTTGGRLGWRLPTLQELASLVDPTQVDLALPAGHPFSNDVQSAPYWSATTDVFGDAWFLNFGTGGLSRTGKSQIVLRAWCVRGGQGVDPQ